MKITFTYDSQKDVECLLEYGKGSTNSATQTKVYEQLVCEAGDNPTEVDTLRFIEKYISDNKIDIQENISKYQSDWDSITDNYRRKAEEVFGVLLPEEITIYLTINNRCPYSINENYFFVTVQSQFMRKIAMHELWHFYTWYKFGITWQDRLGKQKYNDIKEALTVLLNSECKEWFPVGTMDIGYTQHKELRSKIGAWWEVDKNIDHLWNRIVAESWVE